MGIFNTNKYIINSAFDILHRNNLVEKNKIVDEDMSILKQLIVDRTEADNLDDVLKKCGILHSIPKLDAMKTCCFTGPRPDSLYGYNMSDVKYDYLLEAIMYVCKIMIQKKDVCNFIVGGALGFDTLAYLAARNLKEKYPHLTIITMVPFINYSSKWPQSSKDILNRMASCSDYFIEVDKVLEYNCRLTNVENFENFKYQERNKAMVDLSRYVCSCYDGRSTGGTFNCLKYIRDDYKTTKRVVINIDREDFSIKRIDKRW